MKQKGKEFVPHVIALAIGAARYAFLAAGWSLPWMREPLPPRYWRKVVAVTAPRAPDA